MKRARNAVIATGLVLACKAGPGSADEGEDAGTEDTGPVADVTFWEDVAPVVYDHCVACHRDDGIAPFSMQGYETAEPWGEMMAEYTAERIMPPFLVDASGSCNTYQEANWLTDAEIQTIGDWVAQGKAEGDPAKAPELPPPPPGLTGVTHTVEMAETYLPKVSKEVEDDYRCFLLDPGLDADSFLTGYEIVPGDPRYVHHVVVFQATSQTGADQATAKDEADPDYGYTCFGDAGLTVPTALIAGWAPGKNAWDYPDGSGVRVSAQWPLIVQIHYNVESEPVPDQSAVKLRFSDSVEKPLVSWFLGDFDMVLPPGQEEAITQVMATPYDMMSLWGVGQYSSGMEVVGIFPHMHNRGRKFEIENTSTGDCYGQIARWDFNWQFLYFLEDPLPLRATDQLHLACSFDTSEDESPVTWGEGTDDEMCLVAFFTSYEP